MLSKKKKNTERERNQARRTQGFGRGKPGESLECPLYCKFINE